MEPIGVVLAVVLAATALGSLAAINRLQGPETRWLPTLRSRFVFGVPWGSLVVIAFVMGVYLFVQGGITDFENPVVIPYRAWSYYYPLGMLTSGFTHSSSGHLLSNVFATAVIAPIAEYAWGHYPNGREADERDSMWTDPRVRAFVIFPLAVVGVGLVVSLFALGPVIGFSGVVFAFVGFAIVRYPIGTLVAILGGQSVLMTTYRALSTPIGVYVAQPSPPTAPSWANIAVQGHALGFFVGFLLGIFLLARRDHRPDPLRLWIAILFFAFAQGLWQIYWFGGQNEYILFQGPGVLIVTALALVVTAAATATRKPLFPETIRQRLTASRSVRREIHTNVTVDRILEMIGTGRDGSNDSFERIETIARGGYPRDSGILAMISQRQTAIVAVLVVLAAISGPAVPVNLFVISGDAASNEEGITIEDYTVDYVEGAENEMVGVIDVSVFGQDTTIESSGVVVSSEKRHIWEEAITAQQLAFSGEESVTVGGPGWRETVHVERDGWVPTGNEPVYRVWLAEDGKEEQLAFTSEESQVDVRISGHTVTLDIEDGEYVLELEPIDTDENESETISVSLPDEDEQVSVGDVTFEQVDGVIVAAWDNSAVQIATEEEYDGRR